MWWREETEAQFWVGGRLLQDTSQGPVSGRRTRANTVLSAQRQRSFKMRESLPLSCPVKCLVAVSVGYSSTLLSAWSREGRDSLPSRPEERRRWSTRMQRMEDQSEQTKSPSWNSVGDWLLLQSREAGRKPYRKVILPKHSMCLTSFHFLNLLDCKALSHHTYI